MTINVEIDDLTKSFGGLIAARGVRMNLQGGQAHGLIGPNGSGKSTLMKCLAGLQPPDEGQILVDGTALPLGRHRDAVAAGIVLMPQELSVVPGMSVIDNVALGSEPSRRGFLDERAARDGARGALEQVGLADLAEVPAGALSAAHQRLVMLAAAIARGGRLLILDEPTAGLPREESDLVMACVDSLIDNQLGVVLVSHHLREIADVCMSVTVMRDGAVTHRLRGTDVTHDALLRSMTGEDVKEVPRANGVQPGAVVLAAQSLRSHGFVADLFEVRQREVVGVVGLLGSGLDTLVGCLSGRLRPGHGRVLAGPDLRPITTPTAAVRAGVITISGNRRVHMIADRSISFHAGLDSVHRRSRRGFFAAQREDTAVQTSLGQLGVHADARQPLLSLSGGNQQRVLLSRALVSEAAVVVAHEPTVGVDVAARSEVRNTLRRFADSGAAVVVASAEPSEVLGLADRIVCVRRGEIVAELDGAVATDASILAAVT